MSYKTEVKLIDGDLCLVIPESVVNPLKWRRGSVVDIEIVDGTLQMTLLDF